MILTRSRGLSFLNSNIHYAWNVPTRFLSNDVPMRIAQEDSRRLGATKCCLQVLGNGSQGISEAVLLRLADSRILFNCGESEDRFSEAVVNTVCVTHLDWSKIGGLLALIFKTSSSQRDLLCICGPPGLDAFIHAAERFIRVPNFEVEVLDFNSLSKRPFNHCDMRTVLIRNKVKTRLQSLPVDQLWFDYKFAFNSSKSILNKALLGEIDLDVSYSYICRKNSFKAWLLSECVKKGIGPGENMLKLWRGESVVGKNGTIVKPEDVIMEDPYPNIIVIDCPSTGFLDDLLKKDEYEEFFKPQSEPLIIVHFTPKHVIQNKRYISWMNRFPSETKHLIVNESNEWNTPGKVVNRQEVCRHITPSFFPKLRVPNDFKNEDPNPHWVQFGDFISDAKGGTSVIGQIPNQSWLKKWKSLPKHLQLVHSWMGTIVNLRDLSIERLSESYVISQMPTLKKLKGVQSRNQERKPFSPKNPRITFLGTCAQGSSSHRNTAAILIEMSRTKSLLLDCGDGTMLQFASLFDEAKLQKVLTSIRCIYISHTHGDHHVGLIGVLLAVKKAWTSSGQQPRKLILLLPPPLLDWFKFYHEKYQSIFDHVVVLNFMALIEPSKAIQEKSKTLLNEALDIEIDLCWAKHCAFASCASIKHKTGWKISYSGDSQYNDNFIRIGHNSNLLIHEATHGSGLEKYASYTKHSTTDEAIKVGLEMNARQIILTHFSRRYPVVPILKDLRKTKNVSVAFDFLQVNLDDVQHLPKLNDAYEVVFEQYITEAEENHARMVHKQLFLNSLESSS